MLLLFALLFTALTQRASAYGPDGHQIVGAIADERLAKTPAGAKIRTLLQGFTLQKASVIPDEIKGWDKNGVDNPGIFRYSSRPVVDAQLADFWRANPPSHDHTSPVPSHHWFHYTDVPVLKDAKYADGNAGRDQWDIVHMISYCVRVLHGDEPEENARKITKPIAIILLAHFVGDIHQPLHVGAEYFNDAGQPVDPEGATARVLEDQGGNTIMLRHSAAAAQRIGHPQSKLHGFWDNQAVAANLPQFPKDMPKEERKTRMNDARAKLVAEFAQEEPESWRLRGDVKLQDYAEHWADEILPIAREAHERLQFRNVAPKQEEDGFVAAGMAEGKLAPDGSSYEDWAATIVRERLHVAGWRLADLLEQALK